MTLAADTAAHHVTAEQKTTSLLMPALVVLALLLAWVGATAVWGWNGFIGGADAAVALAFVVILRLTRQ